MVKVLQENKTEYICFLGKYLVMFFLFLSSISIQADEKSKGSNYVCQNEESDLIRKTLHFESRSKVPYLVQECLVYSWPKEKSSMSENLKILIVQEKRENSNQGSEPLFAYRLGLVRKDSDSKFIPHGEPIRFRIKWQGPPKSDEKIFGLEEASWAKTIAKSIFSLRIRGDDTRKLVSYWTEKQILFSFEGKIKTVFSTNVTMCDCMPVEQGESCFKKIECPKLISQAKLLISSDKLALIKHTMPQNTKVEYAVRFPNINDDDTWALRASPLDEAHQPEIELIPFDQ